MAEEFTKREFEVLKLLAHGYDNTEIAKNLCVSITTVKTHIDNIYSKIHLSREYINNWSKMRVHAALYYWQKYNNGLIDLTKERV